MPHTTLNVMDVVGNWVAAPLEKTWGWINSGLKVFAFESNKIVIYIKIYAISPGSLNLLKHIGLFWYRIEVTTSHLPATSMTLRVVRGNN